MKDTKTIIDSGLEIISAIDVPELTPMEIRDILYTTITKDYETIGRILEIAKKEGLVKREENTYRITPEASSLEFEKPKIVSIEEDARCGLCGKGLKKGYYIVFSARTLGPYGPECARKIKLGFME